MKFTALSTFVVFNGQMNVFNAGSEGDLPEEVIQPYIEGGKAKAIVDADEDPSLADDAAALAEMTGAVTLTEEELAAEAEMEAAVFGDAPPPADAAPAADAPPAAPAALAKPKRGAAAASTAADAGAAPIV